MANVIRHISGNDDNSIFSSRGLSSPHSDVKTRKQDIKTSGNWDVRSNPWRSNPHRAIAAMIEDPRLQILRARKKPPHEERAVHQSLLERLVYQLESDN